MKKKIDWSKIVIFLLDELFFAQKELAEVCNVTQQSVSNWKNKVRDPSPQAKRKLIEMLDGKEIRINTFYSDYDPKQQIEKDDSVKELFELYHAIPKQKKEFILELARFEYKQSI